MSTKRFSKIVGSGSYIPTVQIKNEHFLNHEFFEPNGQKIETSPEVIIEKFKDITGITERKYASDDQQNSDLAYLAAKNALESSKIDKESLDYIIVAQNFGDVKPNSTLTNQLPCLAAKVKNLLQIENPKTIAYDILFGCPGWIQGMIQADYYIKSGDAQRVMVIGSETLSRVCDPHDRDSMIYSDGAGAAILEACETEEASGILSHAMRTDTINEAFFLRADISDNADFEGNSNSLFIKMYGRKIYEYAITNVPGVVKESIDKAGLGIKDIKRILIHQANEKMDEAITKRLFRLYQEKNIPKDIMPMIIKEMGNNSVATVPILYDQIAKDKLDNHKLNEGDYVVFASVGAGMNINAFVYKV
ncbi:ketoacyl-ACP synthase III [Labilibaculum sp. A4]|uniref:3-oxoacyl-ACP synthase III family protein n=1 Tax=Labilibaculum euxinus TaxID=2686357 RepID=UPI000F6247D7|nr:ketoacyl-ACP synthase III [Labilibaculum euxinus]MDQ1771286.1 ketoacyl-ACP synthase III [Labilibaculum euxinus]MWN77073.1 ketoacyl-ACP synthase III [Labilibaculum euxinus]